jgi:hypothetical protein
MHVLAVFFGRVSPDFIEAGKAIRPENRIGRAYSRRRVFWYGKGGRVEVLSGRPICDRTWPMPRE